MHLHAGGIVGGDSIAAKIESQMFYQNTFSKISNTIKHFIYTELMHTNLQGTSQQICCCFFFSLPNIFILIEAKTVIRK